jgi:hypothetical protein
MPGRSRDLHEVHAMKHKLVHPTQPPLSANNAKGILCLLLQYWMEDCKQAFHAFHASGSAESNKLCMGTHPMPSVLPKAINFAWAHTQSLWFCQKQ